MTLPKSYTTPALSDAEWAYIAGIFDGEAYIGMIPVKRPNPELKHFDIKIVVAQNDIRLLEYLQDKLQTGRIRDKKMVKVKKPVFDITINQRLAVLAILQKVRPYLIVKAEAADKVISYVALAYNEVATHG